MHGGPYRAPQFAMQICVVKVCPRLLIVDSNPRISLMIFLGLLAPYQQNWPKPFHNYKISLSWVNCTFRLYHKHHLLQQCLFPQIKLTQRKIPEILFKAGLNQIPQALRSFLTENTQFACGCGFHFHHSQECWLVPSLQAQRNGLEIPLMSHEAIKCWQLHDSTNVQDELNIPHYRDQKTDGNKPLYVAITCGMNWKKKHPH